MWEGGGGSCTDLEHEFGRAVMTSLGGLKVSGFLPRRKKSCYYSTLRLSGAFKYENLGEQVDAHCKMFGESCVFTGFILMGQADSLRQRGFGQTVLITSHFVLKCSYSLND